MKFTLISGLIQVERWLKRHCFKRLRHVVSTRVCTRVHVYVCVGAHVCVCWCVSVVMPNVP